MARGQPTETLRPKSFQRSSDALSPGEQWLYSSHIQR
jgi:hypothetical protein